MLLPPYSPEFNPAENLWHYLRSHYVANRRYDTYDDLLNAWTDAYPYAEPHRHAGNRIKGDAHL